MWLLKIKWVNSSKVIKSGLAHNFIHVCVYTCVHVCLTNKKVLPHQEVFGACKSTRVAHSRANRPQIACSLWMLHQLADFGFFCYHIANSHPCSLRSFWAWCHLQACFTCCKKKSPGQGSWVSNLPDKRSVSPMTPPWWQCPSRCQLLPWPRPPRRHSLSHMVES